MAISIGWSTPLVRRISGAGRTVRVLNERAKDLGSLPGDVHMQDISSLNRAAPRSKRWRWGYSVAVGGGDWSQQVSAAPRKSDTDSAIAVPATLGRGHRTAARTRSSPGLDFPFAVGSVMGQDADVSERLDGTVALITGASSGIGEATALALSAQGASAAIIARRRDRLDDLAGRINAASGDVLVIEADVTDEAAARAAVASTVQRFGRLDTVVANAGVMLLGPVEDAPVQEWERMLDVNVRGLLYTSHAALPHLLEAASAGPRRVADLVLISSVAGRVPRNGSGVYNLTKHGVGAFGESLRQEVTQRHVRVSLVEPGAVATELASHNRPEIRDRQLARFQDVERMEAEDIADAISYIVTRPRRVAINEMLIRPTEQQG